MHGHRTLSRRKQGHINLPELNLHFTQIFNAKICRKKFTSQNWKQNIYPQDLDATYDPKFYAIETGCKTSYANFVGQ